MSGQPPFIVPYPLPAAAAWIGGSGRAYTDVKLKWAKFDNFDGICGIDCTLAGNVNIQIRYDYDPKVNGFHVDAIKNGEHRAYVKEGLNKGTPAGPSNSGTDDYLRAMRFMNNRYEAGDAGGSANEIARSFLEGRI